MTLTTKEISSTKFLTFVPRHRCPHRLRDIFELRTGLRTGNEEGQFPPHGRLMADPVSAGFIIGLTAFLRESIGRDAPVRGWVARGYI